jgi:two-component system, NtrC family, nitrogen regulation sensor histidine kinase GlnL
MNSSRQIRPSWETIFASFGDGLVILDTDRIVIAMNPAAETITGFSAETTLGLPLRDAFPKNDAVFEKLEMAFTEGSAVTLREMPWMGHGLARATVDVSVTPLTDDNGELSGWIIVFRDMTPVKKLEEEVRKADRLAMMGTIAAGLAHEIRNPLGGIKGAAQLLTREKLAPESAEYLQIIMKESDRVNRLVNQLLTFSRPKDLKLEPVNINELIDAIIILQKGPMEAKGVKVSREFDPSLPPVLGDADELKQVFLNFLMNAVEAVAERHSRGGGRIGLKTRLMTDFKIKGAEGRKPGRMVAVEIRDNGTGIKKEDVDKIFTPFFTTKEKGYGLGLAVTQRVIHEHGGAIKMTTEEGVGTTFEILLRSSL